MIAAGSARRTLFSAAVRAFPTGASFAGRPDSERTAGRYRRARDWLSSLAGAPRAGQVE
ncbi:MAG: hypothetical protein ABSA93_38300 [Streptosporangiaceae bacterium]